MKKKKKRKFIEDDQPYKVGKLFIKWLDSQVAVMGKRKYVMNRWDMIENEVTLEAYEFIRSVVKP